MPAFPAASTQGRSRLDRRLVRVVAVGPGVRLDATVAMISKAGTTGVLTDGARYCAATGWPGRSPAAATPARRARRARPSGVAVQGDHAGGREHDLAAAGQQCSGRGGLDPVAQPCRVTERAAQGHDVRGRAAGERLDHCVVGARIGVLEHEHLGAARLRGGGGRGGVRPGEGQHDELVERGHGAELGVDGNGKGDAAADQRHDGPEATAHIIARWRIG